MDSDSAPAFPSNKRYAMHFPHDPPSNDFIPVRSPNPKAGHLCPGNASISTYRTPGTVDEALSQSASPPPPPSHLEKKASHSRKPLQRSQSSTWWMEIIKSPTKKHGPQSRKTDHATIITDATETQPAFESDRFAVQMPTTRLPILDPPVFRAKLPSPSKGQVETYQTYKGKASEVRETNAKEGVRVPSKIVSYDYADMYTGYTQPKELDVSPPSSPPRYEAAGAFPISPLVEQRAWDVQSKPEQQPCGCRNEQIQGLRSVSDPHYTNNERKDMGLENMLSNDLRAYHQGDASSGAAPDSTSSHTPSHKKYTIKVRVKPTTTVKVPDDMAKKESRWNSHDRSPQTSTEGSRTRTPSLLNSDKKLEFKYTTVPIANDAMFGYGSQEMSGALSAAKAKDKPNDKPNDRHNDKPKDKLKEKEKDSPKDRPKEKEKDKVAENNIASSNIKTMPKKPPTTRWPWLRPTGPRVVKAATIAIPAKATAYVDPFVQHATPTPTRTNTLRPNSPRKIVALHPPPPPPPPPPPSPSPIASTTSTGKGSFETGFAQIRSLTKLVVTVCFIVYALVGLYFILDAVRVAMHAMGAPIRGIKLVGGYFVLGVVWAVRLLGRVLELGGLWLR